MNLPNGTGTISKLSGNRRKPYVAKKFVGWKSDDEKMRCTPMYTSIGTFATKREALRALMNYSGSVNKMTFAAVYELWSSEKYDGLSYHLVKSYENAYRYFGPLHKRKLATLKTFDYEKVINEDTVPRSIRRMCKLVLGGMYNYALRHEIVEKDYSKLVNFHIEKNRTRKEDLYKGRN